MNRAKKLQITGFTAFFLSGICAISSSVIVSVLQETYGFSFGTTGTLLSAMSIGNMVASFAAVLLPSKFGTRNTVALLCFGYFLGYLMMTASGVAAFLMLAFFIVGLAKGCTINTCTVMVGDNSPDRTRGMNIMHACYACGALICPFLISMLLVRGAKLPLIAIALLGLVLWAVLLSAGLPGRAAERANKQSVPLDFLRSKKFWLLTALVFCQNAAETSVTGWLVTYFRNQQILSGTLSTYTVTIMWGATLIARLLIAFVFPIKDTFKALAGMGLLCTILYGAMVFSATPVMAVVLLFAFAFAMAGVNPVAIAGTGRIMNATSMGVLLPISSLGAIIMPWIIGMVADSVSLHAGMLCNLVPCAGILVLSLIIRRMEANR